MKQPCVHILASKPLGTIYIGVTSDLHARMAEHSQGLVNGFTKKYGVKRLVYYEMHDLMTDAIKREKQLKEWQRIWKVRLIETANPEWRDLFDATSGEIRYSPTDIENIEHLLYVSGPRPSSG
jgi:putative endonuclease